MVQQGIGGGHAVIHCVTEGVSGLYLHHCPIHVLLMMDGLWAGMRGPDVIIGIDEWMLQPCDQGRFKHLHVKHGGGLYGVFFT